MSETSTIPAHVGFILDGNRRWAKSRGLPTLEGHRVGYDNLKDIVIAATERGVKFVSAYIFSTENWNRTSAEVKYLMDLSYKMITRDVEELNKEDIRVVWLGSQDNVSQKLQRAIRDAEEKTKDNTRSTLGLCFNYGGQQEIVDAAKFLMSNGEKPEDLTIEKLSQALYAPQMPSIDLLVRTSGEQRLSGFMLWRAAYSELYFLDKHWPDFGVADLDAALKEYANRERRFGK